MGTILTLLAKGIYWLCLLIGGGVLFLAFCLVVVLLVMAYITADCEK